MTLMLSICERQQRFVDDRHGRVVDENVNVPQWCSARARASGDDAAADRPAAFGVHLDFGGPAVVDVRDDAVERDFGTGVGDAARVFGLGVAQLTVMLTASVAVSLGSDDAERARRRHRR